MKIFHKSDYRARRAAEYPPITDQLDAIMKGGDAFVQMRAQVLGVKVKFPVVIVQSADVDASADSVVIKGGR